jgi:hypothetical protein
MPFLRRNKYEGSKGILNPLGAFILDPSGNSISYWTPKGWRLDS